MTAQKMIKDLMKLGDSHKGIGRATGISQSTISRLADGTSASAYAPTMERLEFYHSQRMATK